MNRVVTTRQAIIGGAVAAICGLALLIDVIAPGKAGSTGSTPTTDSAGSRQVAGPGGFGDHRGDYGDDHGGYGYYGSGPGYGYGSEGGSPGLSGGSAPESSSGEGAAVSGGS